jgi:hypothetical protein
MLRGGTELGPGGFGHDIGFVKQFTIIKVGTIEYIVRGLQEVQNEKAPSRIPEKRLILQLNAATRKFKSAIPRKRSTVRRACAR